MTARAPAALARPLGAATLAVLAAGCAVGRAQPASEVALAGPPDGVPVIALHGAGQSGAELARELFLVELADELGLCVAVPDGRRRASYVGRGWLDSDEERLLELTDRLGGQARLIGYSSGGFMASFLALKHPERFPRVCVIGAGVLERHVELLPAPGRRPAFWFVAGEADGVVPLDGGTTPIGRSLTFEGFLGPGAAAQLVSGLDEPEATRRVDFVGDERRPFGGRHGDRYGGAETTELDYGTTRLSVVAARRHTDALGREACLELLRWLAR